MFNNLFNEEIAADDDIIDHIAANDEIEDDFGDIEEIDAIQHDSGLDQYFSDISDSASTIDEDE
jgi:hypothetical protein